MLLDWNLLKQTDEEVLQAVKSVGSAIPVVVMTGSDIELKRVELAAPIADEYIKKQIDPEKYIELLRSCGAEQ